MRIVVDAMGGDHSPKAQVAGAMAAVQAFKDIEITLVGSEPQIKKHLSKTERIDILHTDEVIDGDESPTKAIRRKKQSSMVLSVQEVKEGRAAAGISCGNTGAFMTAGLLHIGRIHGVERPALAPTLPTVDGSGFLLLDAGANMDAKATHLYQHAILGSTYMQLVRGVENPRVGLVNIGTEKGKGNNLMKETYEMLEHAPVNFVGNVESRDLLDGVCDVAVCDGFSGNLVLKSIEGTASTLFSLLKKEFMASLRTKLAAAMMKTGLMHLREKMNYSHHGGATLVGLQAPLIKCHGSSDHISVYHSIRQARQMAQENVTHLMQQHLEE